MDGHDSLRHSAQSGCSSPTTLACFPSHQRRPQIVAQAMRQSALARWDSTGRAPSRSLAFSFEWAPAQPQPEAVADATAVVTANDDEDADVTWRSWYQDDSDTHSGAEQFVVEWETC